MRMIITAILLFSIQARGEFTPAVIYDLDGNTVKALRTNINLNDAASIKTGAPDPSVTATNAPQGSIYMRTGASGGTLFLKQDSGLSTNWTQAGAGGSVSSVALTLPAIFNVTGSPVTSSGTIAASLNSQIANSVWAGPVSGPNAPPAFRALVAADFPGIFVTTVTGTPPIVSSGGSTPAISIPVATSSVNGYLSSADWTTFNNKVPTTRTISTTAPLQGGTNLGTNITLSIPLATTSTDGYLNSTDWNTFNNKSAPGNYITALTGDVSASGPGSVPAQVAKIQGFAVAATSPTSGQVLTWNSGSTQYEPKTPTGGSGSAAGPAGSIQISDGASGFVADNLIFDTTGKSIWFGFVSGGGAISTSTNGSLAFGQADDNAGSGVISTDQRGSLVHGFANGGTLEAGAGSEGSTTFGFSQAGATIYSSAGGSTAWGSATGTSTEISTESGTVGSTAWGSAAFAGTIHTNQMAASAHGFANNGASINANGIGSEAFGVADGAGAVITTVGNGAFAHGSATAGFTISAAGDGAYSGGRPTVADNLAGGISSFTQGDGNSSSGDLTATFGQWNLNNTLLTTVVGRFSDTPAAGNEAVWDTGDPLFVVGNGDDDSNRHNAFMVRKDGRTFVGGSIVPGTASPIGLGDSGHSWPYTVTNQIRNSSFSIVMRPETWTLENTSGPVLDWSATAPNVILLENDPHLEVVGITPAVTSCGTGPTIVGNDIVGEVTVGTGAPTTCGITFFQAWNGPPVCNISSDTDQVTFTVARTTTDITINASAGLTAASKMTYHCVGYQ